MKKHLSFLFAILFCFGMYAQNTVGLISYNVNRSYDGYSFYFPHGQGTAYLIDNCGELVHSWEDVDDKPGNAAYILENGDLMICKSNGFDDNPHINAGGSGHKVERRDWDNNLLWEYVYSDENKRLHHDIKVLPNGNVLMIAWEFKDSLSCIQAGRDPSLLPDGQLWPDHIIEVQQTGLTTGDIVWEWHIWDHLIQDFDATKDNFGVVADHPEKINVNYQNNGAQADWNHINSIDYHPDLDQILLSVPFFNEIWIIDHSTTTEEAKGSTGGNANRGGDLLFRWGNPLAYNTGTIDDQKLFFQHDAHWIDFELEPTVQDYGKISLFNNRLGGNSYSKAAILNPTFDENTQTYMMAGITYAPTDFDWEYMPADTFSMFSNILSSVQRLPNDNTLICAGRKGYSLEVTQDGEIVWEFINPINSGEPVAQGVDLSMGSNLHFRMNRYPLHYVGFAGRDLSPKGFIELNPDELYCSLLLDVNDEISDQDLSIFPNPSRNQFKIEWEDVEVKNVQVLDVMGKVIYNNASVQNDYLFINTNNWNNGIYFVQINHNLTKKITVMK